jgi:predicted phage terminase large subunit-like protein
LTANGVTALASAGGGLADALRKEAGPGALAAILGDADGALLELDRVESEERLTSFVRLLWPVLEPRRPYVHGWVVDRIAEHLEAVTRGELRRLVINVPPGTSKSMVVSVLWPAWEWGPRNRADLRYVFAAYAEALTIRDNRRSRAVITSPLFQRLWGDRVQLDPGQNAKGRFDTMARGFRIATSVEGLGTGERGDRFVIDDPHSVGEVESEASRESTLRWFAEVVPTRITDAESSAIVAIMQRTHSRDVSGLILKKELGYEWLCLPMEFERRNRCFTGVPRAGVDPEERALVWQAEADPIPRWVTPAEAEELAPDVRERARFRKVYPQDPRQEEDELLWPERFSRRYLDEELKPTLRSWGGTYAEAGQLQQRPSPRAGGDFKRENFQYVDAGEIPERGHQVRGWDLAGSDDARAKYTAGVRLLLAADGRLFVTDVVRERKPASEVEDFVLATARRDGPLVPLSIPQDPGQAGLAQRGHFAAKLHGFDFHFSPESGDKWVRARPFASEVAARNVYLKRAAWTDAFVSELCAGRGSDFTDQLDATSRAYARLIATRRRESPGGAPQAVSRDGAQAVGREQGGPRGAA